MLDRALVISVAVLFGACCLLCTYTQHLKSNLDRSEREISHLTETLAEKVKEAEIHSKEIAKLNQSIATIRKTAVKNEDKLTNAINSKKDSCTDATVSDDILNILRN